MMTDGIGVSVGSEGFRTDTDISGAQGGMVRELTPWTPDEDVPLPNHLENTFNTKKGGGSGSSWDQFATNEKLFGVRTTFDEELYTTRLDKSSKDYQLKERKAAREAAEIMAQAGSSSNFHVLEERGQIDSLDYDEEDRYVLVLGMIQCA
jgi:PAB1-binding protein PBP1